MTQTEAIIIGLNIKAKAIGARVAAMQAFNGRMQEGQCIGYDEMHFFACETELQEIAKEIFRLSSRLSIDPPNVNLVASDPFAI